MKQTLLALLLCLLIVPSTVTTTFADNCEHGLWDRLLKQHVTSENQSRATQVDYRGMSTNRADLNSYLNRLSSVSRQQFDGWSREVQLAFLINAYNAWTVELILTAYPDLESIKDLGSLFRSPWSKRFIPLLRQKRSLDNIEHELIRGSDRYQDPRIHFAVNCASIGCPALRAEAYQEDKLDAQLEEQTRLFLSDRSRNRLEDNRLKVSSLFKWYREDFEKGWLDFDSVTDFLVHYADALALSSSDVQRLQSNAIEIDFLDYDWRLNDKR